jgi:hypothetical protein
MPLPFYTYWYKILKIRKRKESMIRLFPIFLSKKNEADVDKYSRQEEGLQRKVIGEQAASAQED